MEPTDYLLQRQNIRSGDLLAWSSRISPWSSWYAFKIFMVRLFQRSEYDHVGVALVFGGRVWVIEAVNPLVRLVPLSNLLPAYWTPTELEWNPKAEDYALGLVGSAQYSEWEAIRAFFGANHNPNMWECAELVRAIYSFSGLDLPGRDTPSDVVRDVQQRGGATRYLEPFL